MNGEQYVRRCLSRVVDDLVRRRRVFQQDGAKCHTKKTTLAYLQRKQLSYIESWPSSSPDLNCIEALWNTLHSRTAALHPETEDELWQAAQQAWASITQAEIDKLCRGFAAKLKSCVKKDGHV
jgi:hypothetical protein